MAHEKIRFRRLSGYVIDLLITVVPMYLFVKPFVIRAELNPVYALFITYLSYVIYCFIFESVFHITLGKIVTKTRLEEINKKHINILSIFIRSIAKLIPFNDFITLFTGFSFHEKISNIYTVKKIA